MNINRGSHISQPHDDSTLQIPLVSVAIFGTHDTYKVTSDQPIPSYEPSQPRNVTSQIAMPFKFPQTGPVTRAHLKGMNKCASMLRDFNGQSIETAVHQLGVEGQQLIQNLRRMTSDDLYNIIYETVAKKNPETDITKKFEWHAMEIFVQNGQCCGIDQVTLYGFQDVLNYAKNVDYIKLYAAGRKQTLVTEKPAVEVARASASNAMAYNLNPTTVVRETAAAMDNAYAFKIGLMDVMITFCETLINARHHVTSLEHPHLANLVQYYGLMLPLLSPAVDQVMKVFIIELRLAMQPANALVPGQPNRMMAALQGMIQAITQTIQFNTKQNP